MNESPRPALTDRHLDERDLAYLESVGKTRDEIERELRAVIHGVPHTRLTRPCRPRDGMVRLGISEQERLARRFRPHAAHGRAMKFVAASGAASRMFKSHIHYYLGGAKVTRSRLLEEAEQGRDEARELLRFFDNLPRFPFYADLHAALASRGMVLEELLGTGSYGELLHCLLGSDGLGYRNIPKGLTPFHAYPDGARTAFEEHLVEAAAYVRDRRGEVRVHFTVTPGEEARVQRHLSAAAVRCADAATRYLVTISTQHRATDTVAVGTDGAPVRDRHGRILLWPSGHGALLKNLNELRGDIIFIRTIDNILPDRLKSTVVFFKQVLGGLLVTLQERVFDALEALESAAADESGLRELEQWVQTALNRRFPEGFQHTAPAARARTLCQMLNRPLRVCAMVKHEGEPGGGPFWVVDRYGQESLQIVEAAQVDMSCRTQREIWESSEYFNPADIVCGVRDRHGEPFDLSGYADAGACFISSKQHEHSTIRVLERPGLWNGSMAHWNTVFVEVPKATLNPVKNVLDLLKTEHQA